MPRRTTTEADYRRRLQRVEQLLQDRLDEPLDPAALAEAAHLSLHHFHRVFRAQMGESVMEHVRRLRLERAARKMRATRVRLIDLALEAGYDSHEAFTRAFTGRFGVTPSRFRARAGPAEAGPRPHAAAGPAIEVEVRACAPVRVAFMRHHGSYGALTAFWPRMVAWATRHGLIASVPSLFGLCPDDPDITAEEHLRFDACVRLADERAPDAEVGITEIPGGAYAVGVHRGPYERLPETYLDVIGRWFPRSGFEPAPDPVVEHYLDDPSRTPPSELRTEVRVRIAEGTS